MVPTELGRRPERSVRAAASRRVAVALELHVSSRLPWAAEQRGVRAGLPFLLLTVQEELSSSSTALGPPSPRVRRKPGTPPPRPPPSRVMVEQATDDRAHSLHSGSSCGGRG
jgi:hypothetical protein